MKKFLEIFAQLIFIGTISVAPVYAQAVTPSTTTSPREQRLLQKQITQQQKLDTRVTDLKKRADTEIERRITALNKLSARIAAIKHITDSQKSTFSTEIQTEITNLTNLKTKIDADTDITTLRTDVQSIVKEYRVFVVFMPQIQIIAAADRVLQVLDSSSPTANFATLGTKLQTRITEAKTQGKDVTALNTALTDMQNKLADAKTQATNAIDAVSALTPAGYPANASSLQSARKMLQGAYQDLVTARQDAKTIISGLKALGSSSVTPTP